MQTYRSLALTLCAAALAACGGDGVQEITAPAPGTAVKFFNFGLNAPSVNFYANNTKLTAISATSCTPPTDPTCLTTGLESTTGVAYGSAGDGALYVGLTPGSYTLSGRITTTTDNGVAVSSTASTLEMGKYYSYYLSGLYDPATKKSDSFIVEDPIPATLDPKVALVRFVNASYNAAAMTLYAKSTVTAIETAVGGPVAYKSAGAFTALPEGIYDLTTRTTGSTAAVIARAAVSFSAAHAYSISARGDITVTSTTATNRGFLDNTSNR